MSDDRFDDDGAPPRPRDEHEREMAEMGIAVEGEIVQEDEDMEAFVSVAVSPDRIAAVSRCLIETMNKTVAPLEPLYFEIGVAVANLYLETTRLWLKNTESLVLYQRNRDKMLYVLEMAKARINEIPFAGFKDIATDSDTVN